jgi:hypothetical protein
MHLCCCFYDPGKPRGLDSADRSTFFFPKDSNLADNFKISIACIIPVFMLSRYRKSRSQSYAPLEIAIDGLLALLLLGIYIPGIVILASVEVDKWSNMYNYKLARGIPQIYSNLSCILIW